MEYIDKKSDKGANALIDDFLEEAKKGPFSDRTIYDLFSSYIDSNGVHVKHSLIDNFLLPEQSNRCCYCMKKLKNHEEVSIEHIIPQSVAGNNGLNYYFQKNTEILNAKNVCLTADYFAANTPPCPPYPHKVAYYNFAASCKDGESCNNKRGNEDIEPIFLYANISKEVKYNPYTGEAEWSSDPVFQANEPALPTLEILGLNNEKLRLIRAFWMYLKRHGKQLSEIRTIEQREEELCEMLGEMMEHLTVEDIPLQMINLSSDFYWNQLKDYDYFYDKG